MTRIVPAIHGVTPVTRDPDTELELSDRLARASSRDELLQLASRHAMGETEHDAQMRRAIWRALARRFGHGVRIGRGAIASHPETFEIGDGVFIGEQAFIQGRTGGRCIIGNHAWIGPQSYLDARDLEIEEYVGWGPGARALGSQHTGRPADVPIIQTDLEIQPTRIGAWADIGVNAVILPGVIVGKGAIVGAGAVVTRDVDPFSIVAGVPAKFLRWREGHERLSSLRRISRASSGTAPAKLYRRGRHWTLRRRKDVVETGKHARAQVKLGRDRGRDTAQTAYAGVVRTSRYWDRLRRRAWPAISRDVSARRELRAAAAGSGPIILGPWLSEVGYEALYWVPFVRWFARNYDVDPERIVALSRGGVAAWYGGIASRYVEQFDLFTPREFAARNEARRGDADQKQLALSDFDNEVLSRARRRLGIETRPCATHRRCFNCCGSSGWATTRCSPCSIHRVPANRGGRAS